MVRAEWCGQVKETKTSAVFNQLPGLATMRLATLHVPLATGCVLINKTHGRPGVGVRTTVERGAGSGETVSTHPRRRQAGRARMKVYMRRSHPRLWTQKPVSKPERGFQVMLGSFYLAVGPPEWRSGILSVEHKPNRRPLEKV